jgi:glycosyltransferase involved in cell wall biosynthesis
VLELGLAERVHLSGWLRRTEVTAMMNGAEVFVMPSRVEPFGIVVLEAWRAGVPSVVTPHGGAPEFVEDGVTGLVVDPEDPALLAAAIKRLLVHGSLRSRLAGAGREEIHRFDWVHITGRYEALYERVAGSRLRARSP